MFKAYGWDEKALSTLSYWKISPRLIRKILVIRLKSIAGER
jgi:hypothetical protein